MSAFSASTAFVARDTNSFPQNFGTGMPSSTSLRPKVPKSVCALKSQHSATAHPPAGHAPRIAHAVARGERRRWVRNTDCARQNWAYRAAFVFFA